MTSLQLLVTIILKHCGMSVSDIRIYVYMFSYFLHVALMMEISDGCESL